MTDRLIVSSSPHVMKKTSVSGIMWRVNAALLPAGIVGIVVFGFSSLWCVVVSVGAALATEALIQRLRRKKVTVSDGSAFMTGLLLAYNLPAQAPWWLAVVGSVFAIAIGKQAFGGLGRNIFNPALAGRAFLMAAWPQHMTSFMRPFSCDAVTQATPLNMIKEGTVGSFLEMGLSYGDLFLGNRGGCLGEVCVLALVLGGLYLLYKRIISWHIPVTYILSVGVLTWIFGSAKGLFQGDFLFHILSGGLFLGAIYMATDYVTSPMTRQGQVIFGAGCGLLTCVIRLWGGYPEGVCYSILVMNAFVPLIDRFVQGHRYGVKKQKVRL